MIGSRGRSKSKYALGLTGNRVRRALINIQSNFNMMYNRTPVAYRFPAKAAAAYEALSFDEAMKVAPPFRAELVYTRDEFGEGSIDSFAGPPYTIQIGLGGLEQELASDSSFSDLDFTRVVVSVQHELWHLHDATIEQMQPDSELGARLAMSDVVAQFNQGFYMYNYSHNVREIRAERHGIEDALGFVSDAAIESGAASSREAADALADKCMLEYVNFRLRSSDSYFIKSDGKSGFTKMSDVYAAFDKAEQDSHTCDVVYPNSRRNCGDVVPAMLRGGHACFSDAVSERTSYADREVAMAGILMYAEYDVDYTKWKAMKSSPYRFVREHGSVVVDSASFENVFGFPHPLDRGTAHNDFVFAQEQCKKNLESYRKFSLDAVKHKAKNVFSKPSKCAFSLSGLDGMELDLSSVDNDFQMR